MQRHHPFLLVAAAVMVGASSLVAPAEAFSSPASLRSGRQNLQATRLCALEPRGGQVEAGVERRALLRASFIGAGLAVSGICPPPASAGRASALAWNACFLLRLD
jgi:hypothetical protein